MDILFVLACFFILSYSLQNVKTQMVEGRGIKPLVAKLLIAHISNKATPQECNINLMLGEACPTCAIAGIPLE